MWRAIQLWQATTVVAFVIFAGVAFVVLLALVGVGVWYLFR